MRRVVVGIYPPRATALSLILTPLVALSVSYPMLLTKWYLPAEAVEDTLGTLLLGCFGGFAAKGELSLTALSQYLMILLPPIVLAGYGYARQTMRWQWMTASRFDTYAAWWRQQLAEVWLGAAGYRLVQVGLVFGFSLWEHRLALEPLRWTDFGWLLTILILHTALWMHLQLLMQLIFDDARIGFGVPLLFLVISLILSNLSGFSIPFNFLPGLWGMTQCSWLIGAQGFTPWVLGIEALVILSVSLVGWRYLKSIGLRAR
ncbi:MAG: hypothetical protein ACOYJA_07580 [Christensenellales bacterium]